MEFAEFKENVEQWAEERGIYEQSTEAHQQAKALEEIGEYLTAQTDEERMDAIGDIAVCIVNAAYFREKEERNWSEGELEYGLQWFSVDEENWCPEGDKIFWVAENVARTDNYITSENYYDALTMLWDQSCTDGLPFCECLEKAWDEIKSRKGRMIDGKFVKNA